MQTSDSDKAFLEEFEKELEKVNSEPENIEQEDGDVVDDDQQVQEEEEEHLQDENEQEVDEPVDEGTVEEGVEEEPIFTGSEQEQEVVEEEEEEDSDTPTTENQEQQEDYEGFYKQVMKPFKANGKTIEIRNPEEAISLMQMGANYTRKMQEISEHRKTIATLIEHGITTEEDLLFLIDLKNKNPEAIKKFFKDNDIDPFDIDINEDVNYIPEAHTISEKTIDARAILNEIHSTPEGSKTLELIARDWDDESTKFMWDNPQSFQIIHEQRVSGVYDQIMNEIERQTMLGLLPPNGSIMEKYNIVGNQLAGGGKPKDTTRKPIDTRVARSSAQRQNKKAQAASSPRGGKRTSFVLDDLLKLDDDEFVKAMDKML